MAQWDSIKQKAHGVIIRAGYGNTAAQKDTQFESNYNACKMYSLPCGAYWYSYATTIEDAKKEAMACLQVIKGKKFEYPIYYDIEDQIQRTISKSMLTQMVITFCTELEKAGYYVGVYANTDWFTNRLNHAELSKRYTIWLADYRTNYNKTLKRDMHQFSSTNAFGIYGFGGHLDCNSCTKDFPTIIKGVKLNGYRDEPVKEAPKTYRISITASEGDKNRILELCNELSLSAVVE